MKLGLGWLPRAIVLGLVAFAIFGPLANLVLWAFAEKWYYPHKLPLEWGLRFWYQVFKPRGDALESLGTSVAIALFTVGACLALAVPAGDAEWQSVVRWTVYALIAAEELGITQANADSLKTSGGPEAKRFLASSLDFVDRPGLSAGWTLRMVKQVGNYGEIYERTLGAKSALKLPRRLNALAVNGGLMYAPPFR